MQESIKQSGNNLHMKVVKFLEGRDWVVDINSYYLDDTSDKAREIDIVAWQRISISERILETHPKDFFVYLFIECKYFKNEVTFWIHKNNKQESREAIILEGIEKSTFIDRHHYLREENIAKLYTNSGKDSSSDKDPVFNAITQPLKSLTFFKHHKKMVGLYYPICIYEGIPGIYEIEYPYDSAELATLKPNKTSLMSLKYSYKTTDAIQNIKTQPFNIDFAHFDSIDEVINSIDMEAKVTRTHVIDEYNAEREALRRLTGSDD